MTDPIPAPNSSPPRPSRGRLLWLIPSAVLVLTAAVILVWFQQFRVAEQRVFETLVDKFSARIENEFARIIEPIVTNLEIARTWAREGAIDLGKPQALNDKFMAVLEHVPQVSAVILADGRGRSYTLLRGKNGFLTRRIDPGKWDGRSLWNRWKSAGESAEQWLRREDFDARRRLWYKGALSTADASPFWTEPYRFFTLDKPGITTAVRWQDAKHGTDHVIAFDVLLLDISSRTAKVVIAEHGEGFVLTADGRVIGVPHGARFQDPAAIEAAVLRPVEALGMPSVANAFARWRDAGSPPGRPFAYDSDGASWWAVLHPYHLGNRALWLGIAVPEDDLLARLGGPPRLVPLTIAGVGLLAAVGAIVVVRRYRAHLDQLADRSRRVDELTTQREVETEPRAERVEALIKAGESERVEFKSTVRWNLHSHKPGKEMELAWLKTVVAFLNTGGGVILIGVSDDGRIVGLDRDGFPNDDKCLRHIDNLIDQHVGSGQRPWVTVRLVTVGERKVLMIRCRPSTKPAFLLSGKEEAFYVRSGPASRKLQPSEILAYLEARRKA